MSKHVKIPIVYSDDHMFHNPPLEIYDGVKEPYAEKRERLSSIVSSLNDRQEYFFLSPKRFSDRYIEDVHDKIYIDFVRTRSRGLKTEDILYPSYFLRDTYAPVVKGTFKAARTAVDVALTGAELISKGESVVYSLCRPPGHHAECNAMGGYCYFNNAAIATEYLSHYGRVAILDIDFHHGNGTQNLFYERCDVFYVSIHADPKIRFPYTSGFENERGKGGGFGCTKNYPLPLGTTDRQYYRTLQKALVDVKEFRPDYIVVSLGFDTYKKDPIGGFSLTIPFYKTMGSEIAKLDLPTLIIQEGGYYVQDLGKMALSFLSGIEEVKKKK